MVIGKKWSQVKEPSDIALDGVNVELDYTNNNIVGVKVTDQSGNALRVTKGDYSEIKVLVPTLVEKFKLHGALCGSPFEQVFDAWDDAEARRLEFIELGDKAVLFIDAIKVPE